MFWLFLFFGNGRGLKSPFLDDKFYYLVDTYKKQRHERNGKLYTWVGGYGAQLRCFEWRRVPEGTKRVLAGKEWVLLNQSKRGLMYETSWVCLETFDSKNYLPIIALQKHLDERT